jgi:hypothetical protein
MPIRDNAEARELLGKLDVKGLREDLDQWLAAGMAGRTESDLSGAEMETIFLTASPLVQTKYGVDIWDAMMLLNVAGQDEEVPSSFDEWRRLYDRLFEIVGELNIDAHLQDDFDGSNSFRVWCSTVDYQKLVSGVKEALPTTLQPFEVVLTELHDGAPTGREHTFNIGVRDKGSGVL